MHLDQYNGFNINSVSIQFQFNQSVKLFLRIIKTVDVM